jgi:hypothetical protein
MVLIRHDNLEGESNKNNSQNINSRKKYVRFALEDTTAKHQIQFLNKDVQQQDHP